MKKTILYLKVLIAALFILFCFCCGYAMSYESLMKAYESLLVASGTLFGIFGLWVGILKPDYLKRSLDPNKYKNVSKQSNDITKLLFYSLFVFLIMLCVVFIAPFLKSSNLPCIFRAIIKCLSAGIAAGIFFVLLWEIFITMSQIEGFQSLISRNAVLTDMRERFMTGHCLSNANPRDNNNEQDTE